MLTTSSHFAESAIMRYINAKKRLKETNTNNNEKDNINNAVNAGNDAGDRVQKTQNNAL